jgi:hypothetical protein
MLAKDAWPVLAGAAAACLMAAAWLLVRDGRGRRRDDAEAGRPGRREGGGRILGGLRLPALAALSAFTVSAALDGIAALLPPESPVQASAPRACAEPPGAGGDIAACGAATDTPPRP